MVGQVWRFLAFTFDRTASFGSVVSTFSQQTCCSNECPSPCEINPAVDNTQHLFVSHVIASWICYLAGFSKRRKRYLIDCKQVIGGYKRFVSCLSVTKQLSFLN